MPSQSRCDSQLPEHAASCCSGTSSGGERPDDDTLSTLVNALLSDEKLDLAFGFTCARRGRLADAVAVRALWRARTARIGDAKQQHATPAARAAVVPGHTGLPKRSRPVPGARADQVLRHRWLRSRGARWPHARRAAQAAQRAPRPRLQPAPAHRRAVAARRQLRVAAAEAEDAAAQRLAAQQQPVAAVRLPPARHLRRARPPSGPAARTARRHDRRRQARGRRCPLAPCRACAARRQAWVARRNSGAGVRSGWICRAGSGGRSRRLPQRWAAGCSAGRASQQSRFS